MQGRELARTVGVGVGVLVVMRGGVLEEEERTVNCETTAEV